MKTIIKKIDKEWFDLVGSGKKKFEIRLADFDLEKGDIIRLEEYTEDRQPTGRFIEKTVTYFQKKDLQKWLENQPEIKEKGFYVIQFD